MIAQESASTDSSPRREVITEPCTNRWSPRSTSALNAASDSAPTPFSDTMTCNSLPVSPAPPSRSVAKHNFPELRRKMTRPVTPTTWPVSVSGGRSGYAARRAASEVVLSTPTGYGSIPLSSSR